jgi:Transposase IS116/IS110/IS902 family
VVPNLRAKRHVAKARSLLGRDRSVQAELVRRRLGEILRLEAEIAQADRRLADKLAEADTTLTQIPGVGPFIAAKILGEVGEISRIRSKACWSQTYRRSNLRSGCGSESGIEMADTSFLSFLRVTGSSSPLAANPQVEHMIGVF